MRASAGRASRPPAPRREFRWCPTRSSRASPPVRHSRVRTTTTAAAAPRAPLPAPPSAGDVVEVECTGLAFGGRGVCKLPDSGFVIFCERAVPGERLLARVTAVKRGGRFAEAVKLSLVRASPDRIDAPCPHFDRCGGCTWQDLAYPAQLRLKRDQVLDVVTRIAKISAPAAEALVRDPLPSPSLFRYRNKMEFAFVAGSNPDAPARVGLRPSNDHDSLVEVVGEGDGVGCLLQHPTADEVLRRVARFLRRGSSAARALPAFDRRTGAGVLRSLTIRVAEVPGSNPGGDGESTEVWAMVDIAAAPEGRDATGRSRREETADAMAELAEDIARVPGVRSVVHTRVPSEPELRLAEGRAQGWVKGGRGKKGGGGKGGRVVGGGGGKGGRVEGGGGGKGGRVEGGRRGKGSRGEGVVAGATGATSATDATDRASFGDVSVLHGPSTIPMTLRGLTFRLSAPSFFQTNAAQARRLAAAVEDACGFSGNGTEIVLDLFCGVGTLGLCVAHRCAHVYGWEIVPEAVEDARRAAEENGVRNATFVACNLAKLASRKSTTIGEGLRGADGERVPPPDVVIADPARAGMDASLVATLRRVGAPRVVYVSCNPATQARDFRRLAGDEDDDDEKERAARYEVVSCAPVDMFPHTPHVETVAVLRRVDEEA